MHVRDNTPAVPPATKYSVGLVFSFGIVKLMRSQGIGRLSTWPAFHALRDAVLDRSSRLRPSCSLTRSARLTGGWSASYELVRVQRYVYSLEPRARCQARFAGVLERRSPWRQACGADAAR